MRASKRFIGITFLCYAVAISQACLNISSYEDISEETIDTSEVLHEGALLGNSLYANDCTQPQRDLVDKGMMYGRIAAASHAFDQCVSTAFSNSTLGFGPYGRCSRDPWYNESLSTQIAKAIAAARSQNDVSMQCTGGRGNATAGIGTYAHRDDESFQWGGWLSAVQSTLTSPVCQSGGPSDCRFAADPWPYTQIAGIIWHEAMHTHGYLHGVDDPAENDLARSRCGISGNPDWHFQLNTVPYIIGNCIDKILSESGETCGNLDSCGSGSILIIDGMSSENCTCQSDPRPKDPSKERGLDRPGLDYRSFDVVPASVDTCLNACISEQNCRAYTYTEPGAGPARCYLKDGVPDAVRCATCTSGSSFQIQKSTNRYGQDYRGFDLPQARPELCLSACASDAACKAYSYVKPGVQGPSAKCWMKNGVTGSNSDGLTVSGDRRNVEVGIDRPGFDYRQFDVSSPEQCETACSRESQCRAYSTKFQPKWTISGLKFVTTCFLKSAVSAPMRVPLTDSSVKRGLEQDTDRYGQDYRGFNTAQPDPRVCQSACAAEAQCKAFTFVPPNVFGAQGMCFLKSGVPAKSNATSMVSGVKGTDFF